MAVPFPRLFGYIRQISEAYTSTLAAERLTAADALADKEAEEECSEPKCGETWCSCGTCPEPTEGAITYRRSEGGEPPVPPGYYTTMEEGFAALSYGFPVFPKHGDEHTADDGGTWRFSYTDRPSEGIWTATTYPSAGDPYFTVKQAERAAEASEAPTFFGMKVVPTDDLPPSVRGFIGDPNVFNPPSPSLVSPAVSPSTSGEGPTGDCDAPAPSPVGHPTRGDVAAQAVREVLASHRHLMSFCSCGLGRERGISEVAYRDHVAAAVFQRVNSAVSRP